jgi:hypothetical protein
MPDNLCAEPPTMIEFLVWQDFMPIVPPAGPPLHATITVDMQCRPDLEPADIQGTVVLRRAGDVDIVASPLQADGLEDTASTGIRRIFLSMQPVAPPMTLTEGESITGTATLTIDGQQVHIDLPATPLQFTH